MRIDSTLLAVDPTGCNCTECMIGQYVPLNRATTDHVQALFLGILSDHTSTVWEIAQLAGGQFSVTADDRTFAIDHVALPVTVDQYTIDLFPETAAQHRHRLGPRPTDTTPVVLGSQDSPFTRA